MKRKLLDEQWKVGKCLNNSMMKKKIFIFDKQITRAHPHARLNSFFKKKSSLCNRMMQQREIEIDFFGENKLIIKSFLLENILKSWRKKQCYQCVITNKSKKLRRIARTDASLTIFRFARPMDLGCPKFGLGYRGLRDLLGIL